MRVSSVLSSTILLFAVQSFVASPVHADTSPPAAKAPAASTPAAAKAPAVSTPAAAKAPAASTPAGGKAPLGAPAAAKNPAASTSAAAKAPAASTSAGGKAPLRAPPAAKAPAASTSAAAKTPAASTPAAVPAAPAAQTPKEKADALLAAGRSLLDAHEADKAIGLLEEAHGILLDAPSAFELMRAYTDVGKLVEAMTYGEKFVTSTSPAETQRKIKDLLATLSTRVSTIQLEIKRPGKEAVRVKVDEQTLLPEQLDKPIRVNPGKHELRVTAPGYEPLIIPKDIDKNVVQKYPVAIEMTPIPQVPDVVAPPTQPEEQPSPPLAPMVKVGIGVAAGLGALAFGTGIAAGVSYVGFVDVYNGRGCGADCDAEVAARRPTLQGLSVTSLVAGVAAVGVGTVTLIYARKNQKSPEQASLHVTPTASGIVFHGRW